MAAINDSPAEFRDNGALGEIDERSKKRVVQLRNVCVLALSRRHGFPDPPSLMLRRFADSDSLEHVWSSWVARNVVTGGGKVPPDRTDTKSTAIPPAPPDYSVAPTPVLKRTFSYIRDVFRSWFSRLTGTSQL
jgi:hypothetical protein